MPGYGYAQAARKSVKKDWQGLMFDYLRGRPTLRRVMLLMDARIEVKASDDRGDGPARPCRGDVPARADQGGRCVKPGALAAKQAAIAALVRQKTCRRRYPDMLTTSGVTGAGMPDLRTAPRRTGGTGLALALKRPLSSRTFRRRMIRRMTGLTTSPSRS